MAYNYVQQDLLDALQGYEGVFTARALRNKLMRDLAKKYPAVREGFTREQLKNSTAARNRAIAEFLAQDEMARIMAGHIRPNRGAFGGAGAPARARGQVLDAEGIPWFWDYSKVYTSGGGIAKDRNRQRYNVPLKNYLRRALKQAAREWYYANPDTRDKISHGMPGLPRGLKNFIDMYRSRIPKSLSIYKYLSGRARR